MPIIRHGGVGMRKGEMRRRDILQVAEELFYHKGYESTTINDILESLHLSKGGFYHHFTSKEQLLEAIIEKKAQLSFEAAREAVNNSPGGAPEKLNALFDKNAVWQDEQVDFMGLLMRVAYKDDNIVMREKLKRRSMELTRPLIDEVIRQGVQAGEFFTPYPDDIGRLLLALGQNLTDDLALWLLGSSDAPDFVGVLHLLEVYRSAMEHMLGAPYGSIDIFQMGRLVEVLQKVHAKHVKPMLTGMDAGV